MNQRPKHLNLFKIKLPVTGWLSILHRVSGALMSLALPLLLIAVVYASQGQAQFDAVKSLLTDYVLIRLIIAGLLWSLVHHYLAGLRFLLLDVHIGGSKKMSNFTAWDINIISGISLLLILWAVVL